MAMDAHLFYIGIFCLAHKLEAEFVTCLSVLFPFHYRNERFLRLSYYDYTRAIRLFCS